MINHRCSTCGHWVQSSDHLIGMSVPCRECGDLSEVPAKSEAQLPRTYRASDAMVVMDVPEDPQELGPVEAGWRRLQEAPKQLLAKNGRGLLLAMSAVFAVLLVGAAAGWWLLQR